MDTSANVTFKAPAWASESNEDLGELDEPPEIPAIRPHARNSSNFSRTPIRRPSEQSSLTKAIVGEHEEEAMVAHPAATASRPRRRSMTSNISIASTADLTSDTGFTSPARTNTPSPPVPEMMMLRLHASDAPAPKTISLLTAARKAENQAAQPQPPTSQPSGPEPRKRCIQFACGGTRPAQQPDLQAPAMAKAPSAQEAPRRTPCIKFACPARPASTQNTPPKQHKPVPPPSTPKIVSPSTPKKVAPGNSSPRSTTPRRPANKLIAPTRPRYLRANSSDLGTDGSQFHEFAREISREDDWIRDEEIIRKAKLTIDDTLVKENDIRRLAREDEDIDDDEEDEYGDEDDGEETVEEYDGYSTDEETGFAESDESGDEDDDMDLWVLGGNSTSMTPSQLPAPRRPSLREQHSDSSTATTSSARDTRKVKPQRIQPRGDVSDLPDSTDFVCGTLDEDKPIEEAYMARLAARRNEKLRIIPQDIDPSFPASDPEDEGDEDIYNPVHHHSDEEIFLHGEMEDIHHGQERSRRRKKENGTPPKKYHSPPVRHRHHSPPPKHRHHSPPPKRRHHSPVPRHRLTSPPPRVRGKSPKPLFDRQSPRGGRSPPAPKNMSTPTGSPRLGAALLGFDLAGRPGLTDTKSLPRRTAAFFGYKQGRMYKASEDDDMHVRGAIDIVKGLEKKRLRRKEKFDRNYCKRARQGKIPERKAVPGRGAERMKELGLLMAGKKDPGNYVLSV
ncbi:hypothetical protein NLU13_2777 [Sarocladium strictum]|uniref:Uncharacterized protein n=1 Tax=Sarocladium strictum TaxID=5046 RepID=A0AA39GNG2_SARSR|nr:hypothetical protein NLU13_2777 [Sarocladium strictum]